MDQQKKNWLTRRVRKENPSGDDPAAEQDSDGLKDEIQKWGEVARSAYESCQHGADAEQELHRRRNRSGQ